MHELAHVSLHLDDNGNAVFFDDLDLKESGRMEKEADDMAEKVLIPAALLWESSSASVHMAVAAGLVRNEHNNYRLLSQFVERREIGRMFWGAQIESKGKGGEAWSMMGWHGRGTLAWAKNLRRGNQGLLYIGCPLSFPFRG